RRCTTSPAAIRTRPTRVQPGEPPIRPVSASSTAAPPNPTATTIPCSVRDGRQPAPTTGPRAARAGRSVRARRSASNARTVQAAATSASAMADSGTEVARMLTPATRAGKSVLAWIPTICDTNHMAVLKVAHLGHPILRQKAEPISPEAIGAPEIQGLIDDMLETMDDHDGAGLAAPQVHVSRRLVVYGVRQNPRYPDAEEVPLTVLINPVITPTTTEQDEDWEGCLSVPDLRGQVPRFTRVRVEAWGGDGRRLSFAAEGFHARVVQHECDHLDGVVYLDRMRSMATLSFLPEFHRYWLARER